MSIRRVPSRFLRLLCAVVLLLQSAALQPRAFAAESFRAFKLRALDGTERSLADFPGRVTLVVFFHPTCQYCKAALPSLQTIDNTYKERGLSVIWINVLPEENRMLAEYRAEHGLTAPILAASNSVQRDYRLTMTPTHYLIDAKRNVLWKHAGYKPGDEVTIEKKIQEALGAPAAAHADMIRAWTRNLTF
jgi:thiol-disulfide isomerase/thioredoxin